MHEGSLVTALLRQVGDLACAHGGRCVTEIRVEVGLLAGVEPTLLHEAFLRQRAGTVAGDATLVIDAVGLTCHCRNCQINFTTDVLRFVCPACGDHNIDVIAGDSVVLQSFTLAQLDQATTAHDESRDHSSS